MKLIACNIVKGKFWDVTAKGKKVGFIQASHDGFTFKQLKDAEATRSEKFKSLKTMQSKHDITFSTKPAASCKPIKEMSVYGYPAKVHPYNLVFDIRQHLPLFTKAAKSRSYYCAGHYLIKFENIGWVIANNPKLITINRYPYRGPFQTMQEAKSLRNELTKEENEC